MRTGTAATIIVLAVLALASPAHAIDRPLLVAERAAADTVLVREGDVVDEDLYAGGNRVLIEGAVQGDLVVAAFQELVISGTVKGDVVGYSPSVTIDGSVGGSVRMAADVIRVPGELGGDLFTSARIVVVSGSVGRDVQAWSLSLDVRGRVGRDIRGWVFDQTRLGGSVGGDVEITVGRLEVMDGTKIDGSLGYRSDRDAKIGEGVEVGRVLTRRDPVTPNVRVRAIFGLTGVLAVLAVVALGFLLFWLTPRTLRKAIESVQTRTLLSFVLGLVVLVVPIGLLVFIVVRVVDSSPELALPAAVIGLPIGLLLLGLTLFGLLVSPVPVLTALGERLTRGRRSVLFGYLLGMLIWILILFVPVLRVFVTILLALLGLGAWTLGMFGAKGESGWALEPAVAGPDVTEAYDEGLPEEALPGLAGEADWADEPIGEPFDGEMELPFDDEPGR